MPDKINWLENKPPKVIENKDLIILSDFDIYTARAIQENRADIVVKKYDDKACLLIDMYLCSDTNVSHRIFEKLSKYQDLKIEVPKM